MKVEIDVDTVLVTEFDRVIDILQFIIADLEQIAGIGPTEVR